MSSRSVICCDILELSCSAFLCSGAHSDSLKTTHFSGKTRNERGVASVFPCSGISPFYSVIFQHLTAFTSSPHSERVKLVSMVKSSYRYFCFFFRVFLHVFIDFLTKNLERDGE